MTPCTFPFHIAQGLAPRSPEHPAKQGAAGEIPEQSAVTKLERLIEAVKKAFEEAFVRTPARAIASEALARKAARFVNWHRILAMTTAV